MNSINNIKQEVQKHFNTIVKIKIDRRDDLKTLSNNKMLNFDYKSANDFESEMKSLSEYIKQLAFEYVNLLDHYMSHQAGNN